MRGEGDLEALRLRVDIELSEHEVVEPQCQAIDHDDIEVLLLRQNLTRQIQWFFDRDEVRAPVLLMLFCLIRVRWSALRVWLGRGAAACRR